MEPARIPTAVLSLLSRPAGWFDARLRGLRWRLRIAAWLAFALLNAGVIVAAVSLIRFDHQQALQQTESDLQSLTRVLEEHVARSFGEAESAVAEIAALVAARGSADPFTERELHALLRQRAASLPEVDNLYVEREDGSLAAHSRDLTPADDAAPAPRRSLPHRLDERIEIGSPSRSADSGQWITPLSRQVFDANGKYLGTVGAAMSHAYFDGVYRDLQFSGRDTILILHAGRAITLMRHPPVDALIGRSVADSPAIGPDADARALVVTAPLDGDTAERITAYRRLADRPLIVGTSRPVDDALADFREHRRRIVAAASLMVALLGALALLLHRDTVRRDEERQALAELNATLEERVRLRTEELEQTNRELLNFSYSISHDLRAPLRAINGFAHALEEDYGERLDDTGRGYVARLRKASLRMGDLIDELLKLASVSHRPLHIEHVDVSAMARDILDELHSHARERVVHSHVQAELGADADAALIRKALENLIGNAWKFSRDSHPAIIQIGGRPHGDEHLFYVTDNGVGFDMEHAARLFQPFQQLHKRDGFEGSGIGLASVRRIVERHGGQVWAESAPGAGTTLFFTLPRTPAMVRRPRERRQG
ncbi:ATP-binding protein [Zoogloea sp.]|uniref:sensor histidine kinase n=1 Tax=Zoogloea sp. TaxID=49181 RepID=UPI0035B145A7